MKETTWRHQPGQVEILCCVCNTPKKPMTKHENKQNIKKPPHPRQITWPSSDQIAEIKPAKINWFCFAHGCGTHSFPWTRCWQADWVLGHPGTCGERIVARWTSWDRTDWHRCLQTPTAPETLLLSCHTTSCHRCQTVLCVFEWAFSSPLDYWWQDWSQVSGGLRCLRFRQRKRVRLHNPVPVPAADSIETLADW